MNHNKKNQNGRLNSSPLQRVMSFALAFTLLFTSSGFQVLAEDITADSSTEIETAEVQEIQPAVVSVPDTEAETAWEASDSEVYTEPEFYYEYASEDPSESEITEEYAVYETETSDDEEDYKDESGTDDTEAPKENTEKKDEEKQTESKSESEIEAEVLVYQTLSASIKQNVMYLSMLGSSTRITLEGVMPEGAAVKAVPVDVEIEGIAILAAYDITIYDNDGKEYQPQADSIKVHIESSAIREAEDEGNELYVYHMENTNAAPEQVSILKEENGAVEFNADKFSIYVVGEDGSLTDAEGGVHYVYTVNFYDEVKGEQTLLSTQVVSPGEKLEQPATPDKEHYTFDGWYTGENGTGEKYLDLKTDSLPEGITEDTEVDLYAHYIEIYYVYFMATTYAEKDDADEVTVFHTEAYNPGNELNTATAEQLYLAEGYLYSYQDDDEEVTTQAVTEWRDATGKVYKTGDEVTEHLELYPVVEDATWIYFDVNGKNTSVDPMYVLASQSSVGTLPEAECEGYKFDSWYTDAEGGTQVTSNTQMNSLTKSSDGSVTLYAHWTADTVSYTINIWLQKATDGQAGLDNKVIQTGETYADYIGYYDIGETIHVSASQSRLTSDQELTSSSTGSIYNWSTYTGYATTSNSDSMYYGFEYSNTEAQTRTLNDLNGKVVASDGSTIINIFYNRITVTWTFYNKSSSSGTWRDSDIWGTLIGLYDTNLLPENGSAGAGSVQTGWTLYTGSNNNTTYNWVACYGNNFSNSITVSTFETRFRFFSSSNAANARFYYSSQSGSNKIYFYKEVTNEATQVDENSDKAKEASDNGALYTKTVSKTKNGQTTSALYVYDTMITMSGTLTASDKYPGYYVVGYNTSPASSSSSMTLLSAGSDIRNSFLGTSNNTCIYNDAYEYTITFISSDKNIGIDSTGGYIDGGNSSTYTYKFGAALDESIIPTDLDPDTWGPNSYSYFTGNWYVDTTMTALFSLPDSMPENNLIAYAKWQVKDITVDFVTNGHADVPKSQTFYAANCATDPSPLQNVQEGYTHVGWVNQFGKIFNFASVLYDDTTLTAIWKNENAEGHELTYNLNLNGLGDQEEDSLKYTWHELFAEGSEEELLTVEEVYKYLELTADEDHYGKFVCWNTQPDGSGTNYYPEDEIVFADQAITLYAIWAIENESTLHLDYNYPEGETTDKEYDDKDITGDNLTSIDLDEVSDIHTGDTVTIAGVTYRFEGWSANEVTTAETATKDSVEIAADATVAVDNLSTTDANTLHAVWVAIYTITVTKEVVDPSNSYPNIDTDTFSFTYSVGDGETQTVENIVNGGTFTITGVENGDTVVISETGVDSSIYTTSYSGATAVVTGEGTEGTYNFIMDSGSTEITVTNTTISHELSVNKVWLDADGQTETGVSHDAVSVQVYEDEKEVGEKLSLGSGNDWTASMEFVFDSNATYTVTEDAVEGYTSAVSGPTTDADGDMSFTVTNTAIPTTTVTATKVWDDNNDQDGKRNSYSLTLTGTIEGETESVYTITHTLDKDILTYTWEDLYTTDSNGNEISYNVSETNVPEGYEASVTGNATEGFTVTNTHTPETTTVSGIKTWDDSNNADNDRPDSITIRLYANGEAVKDESGEDVTAAVTANDNWAFSFEGLDKYADGQEIQYTITEDALYHYSTSYSIEDGSYIVTNTHASGKTSITVQKVWSDDSNRDGVRPESVTIDLMADGEQAVNAQGEEIKLTLSGEGDVWTGTFDNLDIYEGDMTQAIVYSIVEEGVQNGKIGENGEYVSVVTGNATEGYTITNTYTPESADDISVTKVWNDNDDQDGMRDSYSLTLTGTIEGETEPVYTDTQTFDKETLSYTWIGLYKNYNCKEITYSVSESIVPEGYTASVEWSDETKSYTVTNTHTPEKISVAGTKTWDDGENADGIRPDSITIHLYTGEEETDSKEVTADDDGIWTWSFDKLDKYANGVEIQYSITEDSIDYYETTYSAEGYDVTNTHTPGKTYINYTKVWEDDSNRDQVRPESVTIDLMADGVKVDEQTLTGDENTWAGTFTNLVAYDGMTAIVYTIAEEGFDSEGKSADGKYESNITGDASNGYIITNTYTPESADDITATKVWDDSNDQDGKRDSYGLTLTGTVGEATVYTDTQTLDKETLTYTWENLYKNYEGQEITYSVSESTAPEGYEASVEWDEETESYIVTNSYTPETVNVEGSKTWVDEGDQDEKPESITIHLLEDGTEIDSATVTEDDEWAWSFTDLPKYRDGGIEIVYAITEDAVKNYTTEVNGYDVTNTYNPDMTTVTVNKEWDDDSDRDGLRPNYVTVTLTGSTNSFSEDVVLNEENSWTSTVDVPMYDNNGDLVEYAVSEEQVDNYNLPVISSSSGTSAYNFIVTNKHTPATVDGEDGTITVEKVWDDADDQDGIRPESVTVILYANEDVAHVFTLSELNEWTDSVSGMYKYANGGKEITYTVTEAEISVPEGHIGYAEPKIKGGADKANDYTFTVTNKHTPELVNETGEITVTKEWVDDDNRDGMETAIEVQLYANGSTIGDPVSLNGDEDNWSYIWDESLPKYVDGEEVVYSVQEAGVPEGYTVAYTGDVESGFVITNTHESKTVSDLTITKIWEDENNQDGIRPESVTVELQINGSTATDANGESWTATLAKDNIDADGNWTITVDDHPVFLDADGQQITYTLHEDTVTEGYEAADGIVEITEDDEGNYIGTVSITNVHTPETVDVEGTKTWNDDDDADNDRPDSITIRLYADGTEIDSQEVTAGDDWTWSFEDLDKYADGVEIKYTITEDAIYHYSTTYDGYNVINTHTPGQTSITVMKIWDDVSNADDVRPESVTINLLADGEKIDAMTMSGDGNVWIGSFTDLDIYNDGKGTEVVYTIEEEGVDTSGHLGENDEYTSVINGEASTAFIITNTHDVTDWTVEKKLINSGSGEDGAFRLGETAEFIITVTNTGNTTVNDIEVAEKLEGAVFTESEDYTLNVDKTVAMIEELPRNEVVILYAAYKIGEKDLGTDLENVVTSKDKDPDGPEPGDKTPIPTEDPKAHLTVTKTVTSTPKTGETYALNEEITYEITVENDGNRTIENITVEDSLTGDVWTIDSLAPGESKIFETSYTVTEDDILTGSITNVAVVGADNPNYDPNDPEDPDNPGDVENEDTVEIPTEDPDGHITVTKEATSEPANGEAYVYGEEITWKITVINDGNLTITDITVTDELTEDEWIIDSLSPGESEEFDASYKVTMDDVNSGSVVNEATVEGASPDPENPDVPSEPVTDEEIVSPMEFFPMEEEIVPDNDDEANPGSWIDKESVNEYDAIEIEMSTTLPNVSKAILEKEDFSMTFHNQLVSQLVLDDLDSDFTVDINGTPIEQKYYEVDITRTTGLFRLLSISDGCTFHVNVDLSGLYKDGIIDGDDLGTGSVRVFFYADLETTEVNSSYTSTAWYDVTAGDEVLYTSDQSVVTVYTFEIIVEVYDSDDEENRKPLAGATFGLYYDENCEEPVSRNGEPYVLTTDENGQAVFVGIAEGTYYVQELEAPDGYEGTGRVKDVTLVGDVDDEHIFVVVFDNEPEVEPEWTVEKTLTNSGSGENGAFKVGETAEFTVTVTNTGDVEVDLIEVTEVLEGATFKEAKDGSYTLNEDKTVATITDLPEESNVELYAQYAIEEKDLGTDLKNSVTTTGGDLDEPEEGPETSEPIPTEEKNLHFTVTKKATSTPANGTGYVLGEQVDYEITVTNDGNMTVTDIIVKDELTGLNETIDILEVGEEVTYKTSYTVTAEDVASGSVVNIATAAGVADDGTPVESTGTESVPTGTDESAAVAAGLTVTKKAVSEPENGTSYQEGETIRYKITVANNTDVSIGDIEVRDDLTGDRWTIDVLAVGDAETFEAEYTVTEDDISEGKVVNVAMASGVNSNGNAVTESGSAEVKVGAGTTEPVKTGDDTPIALMISLMIMSMVFFVNAFIDRKRRI